jgi:hypothetical protein
MPVLITRAALVAACATLLSACGTATTPGGGGGSGGSASPGGTASVPASSRPASPRPPAGTSLTLADNGAAVRVSTGQTVTVVLGHGALTWHVPVAIGTAVRRTSASGGYPGKTPARAAFRAEQPGRAVLTSVDDLACLHSHPACMVAQQSWRVTVIVTAAH